MSAARKEPPQDPAQLGQLFAEHVNARDLDGMLALYEDTATFVGPDGISASGKQEIRVSLEGLLAMAPQIAATDSDVVIAGDRTDVQLLDHDARRTRRRQSRRGRPQRRGRAASKRWRMALVIDNPTVLASRQEPR